MEAQNAEVIQNSVTKKQAGCWSVRGRSCQLDCDRNEIGEWPVVMPPNKEEKKNRRSIKMMIHYVKESQKDPEEEES